MRPGKTRARGARRARRGTARRPPAFTIRRGTARDVPAILALIRGLAEYERLAHEVEATAARVRRHGFGRRPYFETLICRSGRTPVGFALYFFTYSTFLGRPNLYIEDLFVLPAERGKGFGKRLMAILLAELGNVPLSRIDLSAGSNTAALHIYKSLGFVRTTPLTLRLKYSRPVVAVGLAT